MFASVFKNWIVILWVDYSSDKDCLLVFEPNQEEIELIKKEYDYIDWQFIKWQRAIAKELETKVKIKVPMNMLSNLKSKIDEISFLFSALERYPEEEFLVLDNILLKYVPWFLSSQEYSQLKNIGVVFDENIVSLFE